VIAYSYDQHTKEYLGEYPCQPDPEEGGFLIPGNATDIKPEQPKEGHVMVFEDEKWVEVEDHRGEVWDKESKLSEFWEKLGELPPNLTKKVPQFCDSWDEEKDSWTGHEEWLKRKYNHESSYKFRREKLYPEVKEQLDMLYWDKINGTTNWVDSITKVKEKYPKDK